MAARKSINLLPQIFQTDINDKFLSATLDQLISEPSLKNINGYIGRKFAPTYKSTDSYLLENNANRENYQLEPSVLIKNDSGDVTFFASYIDFLNKVKYYGGSIADHSRLFKNEYYTYDPGISLDKFVNFGQYYWLPNGPDSVLVNTTGVPLVKPFDVTRNVTANTYDFAIGDLKNNTITLARGGTYTFNVDQAGHKFWIQSELGLDGKVNATPTVSTRDVLGVYNNGTDVGTVTFDVPQKDAQDRYIAMTTVYNVDYAAPISYSKLHNRLLSDFLEENPQYAGITGQLNGKTLIFVDVDTWTDTTEEAWVSRGVFDRDGLSIDGYDAGITVPENQRFGVWKVLYTDGGAGDPVVRLVYVQDIAVEEKVYVKYGIGNANKEFYKELDGLLYRVPHITAAQDMLYIQDGTDPGIYSYIKIVDATNFSIDVENDILGKQTYTSPNGVKFTSGLKIQFENDVTPASYQNNIYYVENVGDSIRLVDVTLLVTPELYNDELALNYPDQVFPEYITIKRDAIDLNAWTRNNRWFHREVIVATSEYNGTLVSFDQTLRAQRPIVQFESDYRLFNNGRIGKRAIDILDTNTTDPFNTLEGKTLSGAFGITLVDGLRVLFGAAVDPLVRDKIYIVNLVQYDANPTTGIPEGEFYIKLTIADDGDSEIYDTLVVKSGNYKGSQWWYDGTGWLESQQKNTLQQDPLFDVVNNNRVSFSDTTAYPRSTFSGCKIFGYQRNTAGVNDSVLGFPLTYKNFQTQGDIQFLNYFSNDAFTYVVNHETLSVDVGAGLLQKTVDRNTVKSANTWKTVVESSKQYQIINTVYNGNNQLGKNIGTPNDDQKFYIDILPETEATVPYVKVFVNNKLVPNIHWNLVLANGTDVYTKKNGIHILNTYPLTVNDKVDILIYSRQISKLGHYQVPSNLDLNAQGVSLTSLTLGQMRNHLVELSHNSFAIGGNILGTSDLRDIELKAQGGTILQHSAPLPYASLFLLDEQANYIDSLKYAQKEYTKFKNKFIELSSSLPGIDPNDPIASVDLILTQINANKNSTFSWFYSDMVPYGTLKTKINYTVFDPLVTEYQITNVFNDTTLSGLAVLVYLNDTQLIKDREYTFSKVSPSIVFNTDIITLTIDDKITFVEYSNTDGSYIPETPTKLGLYPKFIPELYVDDTYRITIDAIRGHDGSITPAFNDYRDNILLELEKRIFNNIKLADSGIYKNIYHILPSKFRNNDYSNSEINNVLTKSFLSWVGNNKLDYTSNNLFESNDAFTWNYNLFVDRLDNEYLPGSWRACYMYFYDTIAPHQRPWEMLGFSIKPNWWENYYGPAPYTGGNGLLWEDLEAGLIADGDRAGIDKQFARPGLTSIIPVDENGFLLSPAAIIAKATNSTKAATSWAVGQIGPVEWTWRASSDYPFAVNQALALTRPALYFGRYIDTYNIKFNTDLGQYLTANNQHINQREIYYNGDTSQKIVKRNAGYLNWIADYLTNLGISPEIKLKGMIQNYQVNLAYKMAGFTDKKFLNVLAEQSSPTSTNESVLIPDENYNIYLYKSTPVDKVVYSGVIVEKTSNGYTVRGYDLNNPYFTIIPSVVNTNAFKITVLNADGTIFRDYQNIKLTVPYGYEFKSRQQVVDFLISYERYLMALGFQFNEYDSQLKETRNFKLSAKEFLFWAQQGWNIGSLMILSPIVNYLKVNTNGSIVDAISNSQYSSRILDQNFNLVRNTSYNVTRSANNFSVSLTDANNVLAFAELNLVQYEHVLIFDNSTVFNDVIYRPELGNRQYRLKLVGQKTANWDGSLYAPGFVYNSGDVQTWQQGKDYLKGDLVEYKNLYYVALKLVPAAVDFDFSVWKQLSSSEIKTGLLPNWSTIAVKPQSYYDSYSNFDDENIIKYSHGLIGYKPRQYLADLGLSDTTQIEFYKGYIRQKGSANAVNELTRAEFNNLKSAINYYEEWAVRVGEYGALDSNPYIEIVLDEKAFSANPTTAEFVSDQNSNSANGVTVFNRFQLYRSTNQFTGNIALNRDDSSIYDRDIPTAGYVNLDDVDATIFDLSNYTELNADLDNIGTGYKIWVAKDFTQDWNVYRVTETDNTVVQVNNILDGIITFTTATPHNLEDNEIFLVRNFGSIYDGFYQVYNVIDLNTVAVVYYGLPSNLDTLTTLTGSGLLLRLDSMRFKYMEDARVYGLSNPIRNWKVGDRIWIDVDAETTATQGQPYYTPTNTWKVYEKTHPWNYKQTLDKSSLDYGVDDGFGTSIRMSYDGLIVVAGSPFANTTPSWSASEVKTGRVIAYDKNYIGEFVQGFSVAADAGNANVIVREYGNNIDMAVEKLGVGAPGSYGNVGFVFVYNRPVGTTEYQRGQIIVGNVNATGRFGSSISFEEFGNWLYVGSPDNDTVDVYGLNKNVTTRKQLYTASGSANTVTLNFTPDVPGDANSLLVTISNRTYIPNIDYTLSGTTLTFTETVPAGTVTIIQQPYYTPVGEPLVGPANSEFGYDLDSSLDGAQLAIGAPGANVMVNGTWKLGAGSVYVYDRVIEAFNSVTDSVVGSSSRNYEATGNIGLVHRVTVDGIEANDYQVIANAGAYTNTISFINPPPIGKMIFVETNKFNLLELLIGIDSLAGGLSAIQDGARFGTSLTICSNNCAIYVGAPKYTAHSLYNQGAVWKFHHRGRLYGTNTGYAYNPVFTPGDTIRLDNFEVAVHGHMLSTVLANGTTANILAVSGNVVANVGDYITQTISGANVTVLESNWPAGGKTITVSQEYNTNIQLTLNSTITATHGDFLVQNIDGVIANVIVYGNVSSSTTVNVRPIMGTITATGTKLVKNGSYMTPNVHVTNVATFTSSTFTYGSGNLLVNDATYISNNYVTNTASWSNVQVHPMASLDSFVKDINDAGILGVSAVNQNGFFRLDSDRTVAKNLLRNLSGRNIDGGAGVSDIYESAGMAIFAFMQIIVNPHSRQGEYFGTKVILARNAYRLVIASERGTTRYQTTFDSGEMLIDDDSTVFFDEVLGSGSVYIYELYDDPRNHVEDPGRYAYCQQLTPIDLEFGDRFGSDIDIVNGEIIVSAPGNDDVDVDGNPLTKDNTGKLYLFSNPAQTRGWNLIRYQEDMVDPDTVSRMYLYDNKSNTILTNLEFIDPAKGKILGQAEQDLTYKTEYDPAIYNRGNVTTTILNSQTYWGENQVNQVWWNLRQIRFVDYEQGSLAYRAVNWGKLFPGSSVEVCEWVESTVLPSQYVGAGYDGVPKYSNNEAYVEITYVDPTTNIITSKYYFWVTNKTSLTNNTTGRTLPVQIISDLISNPKSQGIAYAAVIKSNALIVYNVSDYLSSTDTILHLDYDLVRNTNLIHSEYELLQEGNRFSVIPDKISNKMIDSLSGVDSHGAVVPDSKLSVADRYGISSRPRQSMFVDRLRALSDLVEYVNAVLARKPIARQYNLAQLDSAESIPMSYTQNPEDGAWNSTVDTDAELAYLDTLSLATGYRILVKQDTTQDNLWTIYELGANKQWSIVQVQSYSTNHYWEYIDWYADGFGPNEQIEYVVDTLVDALRLPASIGDEILVKVNNTALGGWNLLTVLPDGTFNVVGIQNGTIQLKTSISDFANNGLGFGNQGFASERYDQNPNIEIRYIIQALRDDIFIGELDGEYNKLFFVMMNYLFNEQKYVDWIFKTSFISVTHNLRELTQPANYIKDNQTYYEEYINEVKPYITKIREYLTSYTSTDEFKGSVTDFDLAPYYDAEHDMFRSPSGESGYVASDEQLWSTGYLTSTGQLINQEYPQWYNHRTYSIGGIVITDPGAGYTADPEVIITGGGRGVVSAKAIAEIDFDTGRLLRITVTSSGSGYTENPTIEINGSAATSARAYALLTNEQVRSFDTTLKFDRISYTSSVIEWAANTLFTADTIVSYNGTGYKVLATVTTTDKFNPGDYELYFANAFTNANDRIMAYYAPQDTMPAKDLNQLVYGIEYPGVQVQGLGFNQQPGFPGTTQANITFSDAVATSVGNVITQSESDIILKLNYPITANMGEYITQTIVTPYWGNVFSSSNASPYFWANTSTTANGRVYSSVTSSEQVSLVYIGTHTFIEGTSNVTIAGSSAVRSIWGNVVVDPTTGFSSNVTPWKWSNIGIRPEATIISGTSYVGTPITDASLTVTKVWAANKVTGIINNTTDWVLGNSSITFGNIKVDTRAVGNVHVTAVEYISNNDINPFDTGSFDNVEYDEDGIPLSSEDLLDTVIRSEFLDSTLGTRPEDINISGGSYIDSYGSHAPEELIPGIIYDTLDMKVYTKIEISANVDAILGHRIFKNMVNDTEFLRISGDHTTTLTQRLELSDTEIHVANVAALATPTPSQEIPGVVFIGSERITYWTANVAAGTLGQIRRGTHGTAAQTVHGYGASVIDASIEQLVPNVTLANVSYTTANTYTITDYIAYWIRLSTNTSANIGDTIAQTTSGVDAKVTGIDADSNLLLVNFTNGYRFNHTNVSVQLSGNITANVGDYITQPSTGANLTVVDNYSSSANVLATYNTINLLSTDIEYVQINDAWPTANVFVRDVGTIPLTGSNIAVNGVHNANVYPLVTTIAGNITANGTATFGAGTIFQQTHSWYNAGISTTTDGGGYEQATTEQVTFLKASPASYTTRIPSIPDAITTEDAINITTEDGNDLYEE